MERGLAVRPGWMAAIAILQGVVIAGTNPTQFSDILKAAGDQSGKSSPFKGRRLERRTDKITTR